jgi:hypothetical protein
MRSKMMMSNSSKSMSAMTLCKMVPAIVPACEVMTSEVVPSGEMVPTSEVVAEVPPSKVSKVMTAEMVPSEMPKVPAPKVVAAEMAAAKVPPTEMASLSWDRTQKRIEDDQ